MRMHPVKHATERLLGDVHCRPLPNECMAMLQRIRQQKLRATRRHGGIEAASRREWRLASFERAPHRRWRKADRTPKGSREVAMRCEAQVECQRAQMNIALAQPSERDRHPQIEKETVEGYASVIGKDVCQMVWRRAECPCDLSEKMWSFGRARHKPLRRFGELAVRRGCAHVTPWQGATLRLARADCLVDQSNCLLASRLREPFDGSRSVTRPLKLMLHPEQSEKTPRVPRERA